MKWSWNHPESSTRMWVAPQNSEKRHPHASWARDSIHPYKSQTSDCKFKLSISTWCLVKKIHHLLKPRLIKNKSWETRWWVGRTRSPMATAPIRSRHRRHLMLLYGLSLLIFLHNLIGNQATDVVYMLKPWTLIDESTQPYIPNCWSISKSISTDINPREINSKWKLLRHNKSQEVVIILRITWAISIVYSMRITWMVWAVKQQIYIWWVDK